MGSLRRNGPRKDRLFGSFEGLVELMRVLEAIGVAFWHRHIDTVEVVGEMNWKVQCHEWVLVDYFSSEPFTEREKERKKSGRGEPDKDRNSCTLRRKR